MIRLLLVFFLTIPAFSAHAIDQKTSRCEEYGLGWHFYCQTKQDEESEKKPVKEDPKKSTSVPAKDQEDYKAKLDHIKQTLEDKKAKAVIYPTEENIRDYMAYQRMVMDKSGTFADQWRRTLWKTPELDYTLKRPVSKIGKESWTDQRNQKVKQTVAQINERYGIFFIFSSSCPYCHKYAPILKSFQNKYGITIMPVSMDGGAIPGWDNFVTNKGQIEKKFAAKGMKIESIPATILFDKETHDLIPVGFGVLSHVDLEERIYALTKMEVGDDF